MKINIYNKKNIIKTYTADKYELMFGTVEDLLDLIKIDDLNGTTKEDIAMIVIKAIPKSFGIFKDLMKDIFENLTDEDLRNVKVNEIVDVVVEVVKFAISELSVDARKN